MAIEFFTKATRVKDPVVCIRSNGSLSLNSRAVQIHNVGSWEAILLGYDRDENKVVFKKVSLTENGSRKIGKKNNKVDSVTVSAMSFFKHFGIDFLSKVGKYELEELEPDMLAFSLINPKE